MLRLNNLSSPKGANKNTKRIGRGQGSGQGTQAGKGHKGQKARAGGGVRTGFEGGGLPLYMRLPKKGFSNARFRKDFAEVSLDKIQKKFESGDVTPELLAKAGLIKGAARRLPVKVLGGELTKALSFKGVAKFSASAKQTIEASGSTIAEA